MTVKQDISKTACFLQNDRLPKYSKNDETFTEPQACRAGKRTQGRGEELCSSCCRLSNSPRGKTASPQSKPAPQSIQSMLMEACVLFILVSMTEILIYDSNLISISLGGMYFENSRLIISYRAIQTLFSLPGRHEL